MSRRNFLSIIQCCYDNKPPLHPLVKVKSTQDFQIPVFVTCSGAVRSTGAFVSVFVFVSVRVRSCPSASVSSFVSSSFIVFSNYVWEFWFPGKSDFPGKFTSREIWLPGKVDFPGNWFSWFHGYQMSWIFGYHGFLSIKIHRYLDIIDFLGESWLPGKVDFLEN